MQQDMQCSYMLQQPDALWHFSQEYRLETSSNTLQHPVPLMSSLLQTYPIKTLK